MDTPVNVEELRKEMTAIRLQQQMLVRKEDRKEITREQYEKENATFETKLAQIMSIVMLEEKKKREQSEKDFKLRQQQEQVELQKAKAKIEQLALVGKTSHSLENEKKNKRIGKMADEAVKTPKKKVEPKEKKLTRVSVIVDALEMKSVKNLKAAVDRVLEKIPGSDPKKVASQISLTIGKVKAGKGRFAKYNWDAENFHLTEKVQ